MNDSSKIYIGLDVHKATIAVAVAHSGRGEPEYYGEIPNDGKALRKVLRKINPDGEVLELCYEAGPCGYGLYRELQGLGHESLVTPQERCHEKNLSTAVVRGAGPG